MRPTSACPVWPTVNEEDELRRIVKAFHDDIEEQRRAARHERHGPVAPAALPERDSAVPSLPERDSAVLHAVPSLPHRNR